MSLNSRQRRTNRHREERAQRTGLTYEERLAMAKKIVATPPHQFHSPAITAAFAEIYRAAEWWLRDLKPEPRPLLVVIRGLLRPRAGA